MTTENVPSQKQENSEIAVLVHQKPGSRVEFEITASPPLVQAAYEEAIREVTKEVSLPGFRKGKAPAHLVEKNYPRQVDQTWQDKIAAQSLKQATQLTGISPLDSKSRISFGMKNHSLETGASLSLSFEVQPTVPTVKLEDIELKKVDRPSIDQKKVDEAIRQMRFFFAKWTQIENRGVETGDFVLLDVTNIETAIPEPVFHATRFEVSEQGMARWMLDLVIGKYQGDSVEGISVADETATDEEKALFKPKKVRIIIRAIEQADLPPLDDAFAKQVGVEHIALLSEQVFSILNKQADTHVSEGLRGQIYNQLLTKYPFDLPHALVEKEVQFRMRHILSDPGALEQWQQMPKETQQHFLSSLIEQSRKALHLFYLCRKMAGTFAISITPNDAPSRPTTTLETLLENSAALPSLDGEAGGPEVYSNILLKKTADYIIANIPAADPSAN